MKSTINRRRAIAAVAALAGIGAGALLSGEDASAGRLVTGKQIADSSLTGKDVRDATVASRDVTDGSLSWADFQVVDKARGTGGRGLALGAPGVRGPRGPQGDVGPQGRSGLTGVMHVTTNTSVASQTNGIITTPCPAGLKVVAGGVRSEGPLAFGLHTNVSAPLDQGAGWQSMVRNTTGFATTVHGWAVCASAF